MSIVKLSGQLRLVASTLLHRQRKISPPVQICRNAGSAVYRDAAYKEPATVHYMGEVLSFIMWYWILYHCWYEFDHLVPPHQYPDPSKFTDEELGIPADEED
ncbi:unnamed protein product [Candidula unifasciata]|uniref:NADH dehydrogenase [ubiquinone] 1 beta subcomplex subunit 2, mitochondrial n=1 Tax=Candidula unifasciata TaxID=100452 RepID=A0A8S4A6A7_9EUPU|nr:unnamed protein product [Candidula unifasciata]